MHKLNVKYFLKLPIAIVLAGLLLYGYVLYSLSSGSAFKEFGVWCRKSEALVIVVGQFQEAKLMPFGYAYEKNKGETGAAGFTARIIGTTKTINAEVVMTRIGNTWKVDSVTIAGKMLDTK